MTLADQALVGRTFKTVQMPDNFQTYCTLCHVLIRPGQLAKRYDGATYSHEKCPKTPLKNVAVHKYGDL